MQDSVPPGRILPNTISATVSFPGGVYVSDEKTNRKYIYVRWALLRLCMILFDIFAVNFAYFLALLVRFYVHVGFNVWALDYVSAFLQFAPYYTVCSLIVFGSSGLYNSLWKYAGLSDMNRILRASVITCVIHILGTLLFIRRMPISYYALGAAFQFVLIAISRFSYRLLRMERDRYSHARKRNVVNVLVVGLGESSRTVIKQLERDPNSMAKPVCVIDISNTEVKGTMSGVPVMIGMKRIPEAIRKYRVDQVLIADSILLPEDRIAVKEICRDLNVPAQDFSGYFHSIPSRIPLNTLLEYVEGPVVIEIGSTQTCYASAGQATASISEKYIVSSVYTKSDSVCIRLIEDILRPNDVQADWVQAYQKETGEDISFF